VGALLVALALMAIIWWFSSRPGAGPSPHTELLRFLERKAAHVMLFGALWVAWWAAFGRRLGAVAAALTVIYGAIDEFHQHHVPGRTGTIRDVTIDALGVALAIILTRAATTPRATAEGLH
jgi:VanZ family protein